MVHFVQSSKIGKEGEQLVTDLLRFADIECVKNEDNSKKQDYDLVGRIDSKEFTIECKYDWYSEKSGNLAVEYFNPASNKPSGIDATKATMWSFIINDRDYKTVWLTTTTALRNYIKENKPFKTIAKAGDGNASIYLYKTENLLSIFSRVDNLEKEALQTTIKTMLKTKRIRRKSLQDNNL